jgi:hypothetical protein
MHFARLLPVVQPLEWSSEFLPILDFIFGNNAVSDGGKLAKVKLSDLAGVSLSIIAGYPHLKAEGTIAYVCALEIPIIRCA